MGVERGSGVWRDGYGLEYVVNDDSIRCCVVPGKSQCAHTGKARACRGGVQVQLCLETPRVERYVHVGPRSGSAGTWISGVHRFLGKGPNLALASLGTSSRGAEDGRLGAGYCNLYGAVDEGLGNVRCSTSINHVCCEHAMYSHVSPWGRSDSSADAPGGKASGPCGVRPLPDCSPPTA